MADNEGEGRGRGEGGEDRGAGRPRASQTFQGLGSLRQAITQATRAQPATPAPVVLAQTDVEPKRDALGRSYATGKRKNAVARVWIKPGSGKLEVNGRDGPV